MSDVDRLQTPVQVARRLGVRPSLIVRLIRRRDLAAVKIGRVWRIEPNAVAAYIETRRQDARELDAPPVVDDRQLALDLDELAAEPIDPRGLDALRTALDGLDDDARARLRSDLQNAAAAAKGTPS